MADYIKEGIQSWEDPEFLKRQRINDKKIADKKPLTASEIKKKQKANYIKQRDRINADPKLRAAYLKKGVDYNKAKKERRKAKKEGK